MTDAELLASLKGLCAALAEQRREALAAVKAGRPVDLFLLDDLRDDLGDDVVDALMDAAIERARSAKPRAD